MFNKLFQKLNKFPAFVRRIALQRRMTAIFHPFNFLKKIWEMVRGKILSIFKNKISKKALQNKKQSVLRKIKLAKKIKGECAVPRNVLIAEKPGFPKNILQRIWKLLRDINHGKHVPIYVLIASIIFGVIFGGGLFLGFPQKVKADLITLRNDLDDESLNGFIWNLNECQGLCQQGFIPSGGNPGGAIFNRVSGKKSINSGYWSKAMSWEDLGVPAGAMVVAVDGRFDVKIATQTHLAQERATLKIFNADNINILKNNEQHLENFGAEFDSVSSWMTIDAEGLKSVEDLYGSSDTKIAIILEQVVESGKDSSASSDIQIDNIVLEIDYVPKTGSSGATSGNVSSSPPFAEAPAGATTTIGGELDLALADSATSSPNSATSTIESDLPVASATSSSDSSVVVPVQQEKNIINVSAFGNQISGILVPKANEYLGGGFAFIADNNSADITQIIISEKGTVNAAQNLSNANLYYKEEPVCSNSIPVDATSFNNIATSFDSNEQATLSGNMPVGKKQICLYVKLDAGVGADGGETIEIEISNPASGIIVSGAEINQTSAVAIPGATALEVPAILVSSEGSQISTLSPGVADVHLGGAFIFERTAGSADITQIILTEKGIMNANKNLSDVNLYYKQEPNCSESIPSDAVLFNETAVDFDSNEQAVVSGSMPIGTEQVCLYVRLDVGPGVTDGQTIGIEISTPSEDILVFSGKVSPNTVVSISGTTKINSKITVGFEGSQISTLPIPVKNKYIGGAFTFAREGGSASVSKIVLSEKGGISAQNNLSNVKLFYKKEVICSDEIPAGASQFNETVVGFDSNEQVAVIGNMPVGTEKVCLYIQLNIGSGAIAGETIEIEISNPTLDVDISSGDVVPNTAVALSGSTSLKEAHILVGAFGSQVSNVSASSSIEHLGGAFTFAREGGSADILGIAFSEIGSIDAYNSLSNLKVYYKQEANCSSFIPPDATVFNEVATNFNSLDQTMATGTMEIGAEQICIYIGLDIAFGAMDGKTIKIEITNPALDVLVVEGGVSPASAISPAGATIIGGFEFASYGMPFVYQATNWWGNVEFHLEVYMKANSGTVAARVYDETADAPVFNSLLATASNNFVLLKTEKALILTDGHSYRVQLGKSGSAGGEILGAKLAL